MLQNMMMVIWIAQAGVPQGPGTLRADGGHATVATLRIGAGGVADAGRGADAGVVSRSPMPADVKATVDKMQAFYEKTKDFKSEFTQEYLYKAFKRKQVSSGTVAFLKPGLMRWEYLLPEPKTFVLAGDKVYAYDPGAKLLTRSAIGTNQLSTSVTFLFGVGKLADEFSIAKKACTGCSGTLLELTPWTNDPRFKKVLLEVDSQTAQVLKSTVIDPDGSENAISFRSLSTNVGLDEKMFKLTPPAGTQVQDLAGAKAE
jgi:outer membrane lipoprotein carrier protein